MSGFPAEAAARYGAANAAALRWMLDRPRRGGFLDTCFNPLELRDYGTADGVRGPAWLHGWIQGRGLEALATHGRALGATDPALAARCRDAAQELAAALAALIAPTGHAFFRYDPDGRPVCGTPPQPQTTAPGVYTYSDAFVAKGLVAAARWLGDPRLPAWQAYLARVIAAVEDGRFQMDEAAPLSPATVAAQPDDYGPRMILLGAAPLAADTAYAGRFIDHVLTRHLDTATGLLRDVPGQDACNPGHAIEFVGFALEALPADADPALIATLARLLSAAFRTGLKGPGIALRVSVSTGAALSPYRPWWSLPETVRAAALMWARTGSDEALAIWQAADAAFFAHYWLGDPPIALQTRTEEGPVDYVPATPDLDPGYHTGLSLLAAQAVALSTIARGQDGRS